MRLSDIATYVIDKISSSDISLEEYVTNVSSMKTNRLLQEEINATLMCHL